MFGKWKRILNLRRKNLNRLANLKNLYFKECLVLEHNNQDQDSGMNLHWGLYLWINIIWMTVGFVASIFTQYYFGVVEELTFWIRFYQHPMFSKFAIKSILSIKSNLKPKEIKSMIKTKSLVLASQMVIYPTMNF